MNLREAILKAYKQNKYIISDKMKSQGIKIKPSHVYCILCDLGSSKEIKSKYHYYAFDIEDFKNNTWQVVD